MIKKRAKKAATPDAMCEASAAFVFAQTANAVEETPVYLIEDNKRLRDGVTTMLAKHGIRVIAARSAKEAMTQVQLLQRHVVLIDSAIKDVDSLALVAAVRAASKHVSVVVMDLLPTDQDVGAFVRAGVAGFVLKNATEEVFVGTIRAVAGGANVLPRPLTGALLTHVAAGIHARGPKVVKAAVRMTKRERDVVALIAKGATNQQIGTRLRVATHTVKSHVHSIMEKLTLHTRLQVAAYAHASSEN